MGAMKRYAEQVSVELGYGGEINGVVRREAQRRLDKLTADMKWDENLARQAESELGEEQCQRQDEESCFDPADYPEWFITKKKVQ